MGGALLSLAWSFLTSRLGLAGLAGLLAFGLGYHKGGAACDARQAAAEALELRAKLAEAARQAQAAAAIAAHDRARGDAKAAAAVAMQAEIDRLQTELAEKGAAHADAKGLEQGPANRGAGRAGGGCRIDGDFARRLRQLDAAGGR